jgi:hypothetical protein
MACMAPEDHADQPVHFQQCSLLVASARAVGIAVGRAEPARAQAARGATAVSCTPHRDGPTVREWAMATQDKSADTVSAPDRLRHSDPVGQHAWISDRAAVNVASAALYAEVNALVRREVRTAPD